MNIGFQRLLNIIHEYRGKHICILTHNFPDADAVSCSFALQELLKLEGIESDIYYGGRIDRSGTEKLISTLGIPLHNCDGRFTENDAVIFVDCQAGTGNTTFSGGMLLACIDHHPTEPGNQAEYLYKHVELTGACVSLITDYVIKKRLQITPEVATALLFGLEMDTKNFTREVTKTDIDALGYLHDKVDKPKLHYLETSWLSASDLKAYGTAIANMKMISDIGFSFVPFDCPDGLIAALADFMLEIDEISIAIVFSKRDTGIKLSVRSILPFIDAGKFVNEALAGIGSGGGHAMFAGGFIPNEGIAGVPEEELQSRLTKTFLTEYVNQLKNSV